MIRNIVLLCLFVFTCAQLRAESTCRRLFDSDGTKNSIEFTEGLVSYKSKFQPDRPVVKSFVRFKKPAHEKAPILLFMNGLTKDSVYWDQVLAHMMAENPDFMQEVGIIQSDFHGQGRTHEISATPNKKIDPELQVEALESIVDQYQKFSGAVDLDRRMIVIAHSYGTVVASTSAKKSTPLSKKLKKLILITPYVDHLEIDAGHLVMELTQNFFLRAFEKQTILFSGMSSYFKTVNQFSTAYFKIWLEQLRLFFPLQYQMYKDYLTHVGLSTALRQGHPDISEDTIAIAERLTQGATSINMKKNLGEIRSDLPTDVIASRHDELVPYTAVQSLFQDLPAANRGRFVEMNATHNSVEEFPEELAHELLKSLGR